MYLDGIRFDLIKTYFVSSRKKFEHKSDKLALQNQSSLLQNSADIHYVHLQPQGRFTEEAYVLRSPEDCQNLPH